MTPLRPKRTGLLAFPSDIEEELSLKIGDCVRVAEGTTPKGRALPGFDGRIVGPMPVTGFNVRSLDGRKSRWVEKKELQRI